MAKDYPTSMPHVSESVHRPHSTQMYLLSPFEGLCMESAAAATTAAARRRKKCS